MAKCRECQEVLEDYIIEMRREVKIMRCSLSSCCEAGVGCEAITHWAAGLGKSGHGLWHSRKIYYPPKKSTRRVDEATHDGMGGLGDGRFSLASQFPAGNESRDQVVCK